MSRKEFNYTRNSFNKIYAEGFEKELLCSLLEKYKIGEIYFNDWDDTTIIKIKTKSEFIKRFGKDLIGEHNINYNEEGISNKITKEEELWTLLDRKKLERSSLMKYTHVSEGDE
ncbi:hypothetical protein ACJDU8_12245 [Clostridium sp. WILCCON 0269]|uniref:Uncharacterized protein n=1 Tax=Candidatus Clostridium eludens TaxID=3381663 RepID=A0ABW8SKM6_9CLOT